MSRTNKVLFVTGASSEIGTALVDSISDNYDSVIAHYRFNMGRIQPLIEKYGEKILPLKADLQSEADLDSIITELDRHGLYPDHFVHLAAEKVFNLQFHKCNWEMYRQNLDTGFKSAVILLEHMIPHMVKNKYGKIIFVLTSHTLGSTDAKYQSPYITSKYALLGLMHNLSGEYAEKGITVNGVSPDMVETGFLSNISSKIVEFNAQNSPIKRNVTVSEVAGGITYLMSDSADCISGQNLGIICR